MFAVAWLFQLKGLVMIERKKDGIAELLTCQRERINTYISVEVDHVATTLNLNSLHRKFDSMDELKALAIDKVDYRTNSHVLDPVGAATRSRTVLDWLEVTGLCAAIVDGLPFIVAVVNDFHICWVLPEQSELIH